MTMEVTMETQPHFEHIRFSTRFIIFGSLFCLLINANPVRNNIFMEAGFCNFQFTRRSFDYDLKNMMTLYMLTYGSDVRNIAEQILLL